jgi:ParB family chromosome partitioning protein
VRRPPLAIPFADYWRPTAINYWGRVKKAHGLAIGQQILGDRWARDHANDKKPVLAAALEAAFDPAQSANCIALDQAARDNAAAWMPPGMPFDADAVAACFENPDVAEPDGLGSEDGEAGDPDLASADLPAFLTEDDQAGAGLNDASAS